ncbi:MAG: MBL fold metallo-hydrolase [Patescibacteria group bacterium]
MVITHHGENYFRIQSGALTVLIDPTNQRSFKGATLVIHTVRPAVTDAPEEPMLFWIDHQGEYQVGETMVRGWTTEWVRDEEHTAYRVTLDGIAIAAVGHLTKELNPALQAALTDTDILIVPAGGKPFLGPALAAKLVRQLEPAVVIPSLFSDLKPFLKELGESRVTPEEKLTVKKKDFTPKAMAVRWLTA